MDSAYKDILIKKYRAFELEDNPIRKKLLRFEVLDILKELDTPDSNDLHLWGLVYYMSADDEGYHLSLGLEKFLEAYQLDPKNFMACLYIAHSYHDKGELKDALKYYEMVDKEQLREFQIWRYVKLIEQIGFCNHKLGKKDLGRKQFQQVLDWYKKLPANDVAVPIELFQCLPETDEIVVEIKRIENSQREILARFYKACQSI